MKNQSALQETKHHGAVRFPFNIYPCTIPGDFRQVAVHWQDSMELIYIKRGTGLVQTGAQVYPAQSGDIFVLTPGALHAIRQAENCTMEYENIIFDLELLGGAEDLCAENTCCRCKADALPCRSAYALLTRAIPRRPPACRRQRMPTAAAALAMSFALRAHCCGFWHC